MHQWALPTIAVMSIAHGAVWGRLHTTPVSQAMVFVALGLPLTIVTGTLGAWNVRRFGVGGG